jgi:hypothetical protein
VTESHLVRVGGRFAWSAHCFLIHRWRREVLFNPITHAARCRCGFAYIPGVGMVCRESSDRIARPAIPDEAG